MGAVPSCLFRPAGNLTQGMITQERLARLLSREAAYRRIMKCCRIERERLKRDLMAGAQIEEGELSVRHILGFWERLALPGGRAASLLRRHLLATAAVLTLLVELFEFRTTLLGMLH